MRTLESLIDRDEFSHLVSCIDNNALFMFALTCKAAYKAVIDLKEKIKTTYASLAGSIALIEWAIDNGCPHNECIWVAEAGKAGNLDVVHWICDNNHNGAVWNYAVHNVALGGHLHVLEWAYEQKNKDLSSIYTSAAKGGHIHVLEWAQQKKIKVGDGDRWDIADVPNAAAKGGHRKTLEWLRNNGFEWGSFTCAGATEGGHLDILQWLRAEGCQWSENVYWQAAEGGHLDIVKWVHANGLSTEHSELC